jgi:choline dehydrogenase
LLARFHQFEIAQAEGDLLWFYHTEAEPHLGGRSMHTPRGKVLGGSSSINGLVYICGNPQDFERWESEGAAGWSYRDVLLYFKRAENRDEGGDHYRGSGGPLQTRYGSLQNPLHAAWLAAAGEAGHPQSADINGFQQEGFGRMDMTVGGGTRSSASNVYLRPAMSRSNLKVLTHAFATRIVFDGKCASALEYTHGGTPHRVTIGRELILLGVGENLQDHLEFYFQVACQESISLYSSINWRARAMIGARWLLFKNGLGATNHFETCGFIHSRPGIAYPDIQYHFLPMAVAYDGSTLAQEHGFQAHVGPMRACVRLTREIFAQHAFDRYRGREMQPGADVQIDEFIRAKVESAYHPGGPARGRLVHHAVGDHRQFECPDHHARREGGGSHPRQGHAGAQRRPVLSGEQLADRPAVILRCAQICALACDWALDGHRAGRG